MHRWPELLLAAIEINRIPTVNYITQQHLGREPTHAEDVAARRAAHRLSARGQLKLAYGYDRRRQRIALRVQALDGPEVSGVRPRWRR